MPVTRIWNMYRCCLIWPFGSWDTRSFSYIAKENGSSHTLTHSLFALSRPRANASPVNYSRLFAHAHTHRSAGHSVGVAPQSTLPDPTEAHKSAYNALLAAAGVCAQLPIEAASLPPLRESYVPHRSISAYYHHNQTLCAHGVFAVIVID